jgi:error-prone DNA polymerase
MTDYVELHSSSAFSFLRGSSLPEQMVDEAADLHLPALALLDRDGVYSAPRAFARARERGIRPLVGAEITMEDGTVLPLLVQTKTGYQNLCRLISTAKLTERQSATAEGAGPSPSSGPNAVGPSAAAGRAPPSERKRPCYATWKELAAHAEGLIALTGDAEGPILSAWQRGGAPAVVPALAQLQTIFGAGRLWVELQRSRRRRDDRPVRFLADLAGASGLPLVATGGALHATRTGRALADVFCCLRHHTTLDAAGRLLSSNAESHLRSAAAMAALFPDHPAAVANSRRLAEQLDFTLAELNYQFPEYAVPPGETMDSYLRSKTYAGARDRFPALTPRVTRQLDKELALIGKLKFAGYFLLVWDICQWSHAQGILIQGRGSAANSAVCYSLRITEVDPIKSNLLFERFLSEGRQGKDGRPSWPDIDLDLPSGELREAVIQEVYRRYQSRGAAMVANVITYRGRSAAREVGKVLGLPDDVLDRFSALYANGDFPSTLDLPRQLRMSGLPASHPRLPAMIELCQQLKGLPRHLGQHSGGMVLCPGRLDEVVPIENASMSGRTVVQWDKDDCEDLGLVKIDFLGLGMMAVLQECTELCARSGKPFHLHRIPYDDEPTFEMMRRADTIGVFQIESRAQMATLPRIQPKVFYDVAIQVSIVRPGPITGGLTHPLIRRRAGQEPVICIDPSVHDLAAPILMRTYGMVLFQEQMLGLAITLGGFTATEAEELRRALGFHRDHERLRRVNEKLREALVARGHPPHVVENLVASASNFALYGFPESHAISFALLAYASTWLKVHHIAEFYAGLLNNQPMGFYSSATLIQDGRRHGLKVRPVCVRQSSWKCTVEGEATLRIGLRCAKGIREKAVRAMEAARAERPFAHLADFFRRTEFSAAERRVLASVGALNALAGHRRAALWLVEAVWSAEESLFREAAVAEEPAESAPLAPMTLTERLGADFAGLGLTVGEHPMHLIRDRLPHVWRACDLPLARGGERITIGGSVICRQRPGTAKGVVFVSLEDETGVANAIVSSALYERVRLVLNEEPALCITGPLQNQDGVLHVKAERLEPLRFAELPAQPSHDFK